MQPCVDMPCVDMRQRRQVVSPMPPKASLSTSPVGIDADFESVAANVVVPSCKSPPAVTKRVLQWTEDIDLDAEIERLKPHERVQVRREEDPDKLGEILSKTRLWVGGLNYLTCTQTMNEYFSAFGEVQKTEVVYNKNSVDKPSRGFGFVEFVRESDAADAFTMQGMMEIDGHKLTLRFAKASKKPAKKAKKKIGDASSSKSPESRPKPPSVEQGTASHPKKREEVTQKQAHARQTGASNTGVSQDRSEMRKPEISVPRQGTWAAAAAGKLPRKKETKSTTQQQVSRQL